MNISANLATAYLDYINNYLTLEKFAEHNEISIDLAALIVKEGRIKYVLKNDSFSSLSTANQNYFDTFMLR